MDQWRIFFCLY